MVLVTGGAYSGLEDFAQSIKNEKSVIYSISVLIEELEMIDYEEEKVAHWWDEHRKLWKDLICIHEEVGCGLIPETREKRQQREVIGRVSCFFGKKATKVYRVSCGLGIQIK